MKKPDRGPKFREKIGKVTLREIKRNDLAKDPYRVRCQYPKEDGRTGTRDCMNWRAALAEAAKINRQLEARQVVGGGGMKLERVWKEWFATIREERHKLPPDHRDHLTKRTLKNDVANGRYILDEWGRKRIDAILPIDLELWLKRLARQYPETARMCAMQLGEIFRFARRKRYLDQNLLLEDPIKLGQSEAKAPWVPGWEMVDRLVEPTFDSAPALLYEISL
jgi:hypothetical protein